MSNNSSSYNRKLRYRAILQDLSTLEEENDNVQQMERTAGAVREVQSLLAEGGVEERVKHPGEGYLDSKVLRATSDLALRCSENVSGNVNTYNRHELAAHIRERARWWRVTFPREVPAACGMCGALCGRACERRERAPRRVVQRQRAAKLTAPQSVQKLDKTEEGSEMVGRVHRFLCRAGGGGELPYFRAVLDPTSFSRTVENVYYVSFLARDGLVAVRLDEEHGLPFIKPVPASEQQQQSISGENQFIVSLDVARWKELIDAFDIKEPMMVLKRL